MHPPDGSDMEELTPRSTSHAIAQELAPRRGAALYPGAYTWFVFLSALDLMLTWTILYLGGSEVNALAAWVIDQYDLRGLVLYKFSLVIFVILACEVVGRFKPQRGLRLAKWSVMITTVPVLIGSFLIFRNILDELALHGLLQSVRP